jgi:hypothetical protein
LSSDKEEALKKNHRLELGVESFLRETVPSMEIAIKKLANRFIAAQKPNWRNPKATLKCYKDWLWLWGGTVRLKKNYYYF